MPPEEEGTAVGDAQRTAGKLVRACAFSVHVFTASGAALALLALIAAVRGQWTVMFLLLGVALLVDGFDGMIARRLKVAEKLPNWSGDVLDFVVDFATYVFVPAFAIAAGGLLPSGTTVVLALAIVITSAIYFADRRMKTDDNYFRGFPVLWNVAAFYLFVCKPWSWLAAAVVVALCVLTFAPIKFLHPLRVVRLRFVNIVALALWVILALVALVYNLDPGPWIAAALVAIAVYFFAAGYIRRSH
jgi:phosphatidylcholine synthase